MGVEGVAVLGGEPELLPFLALLPLPPEPPLLVLIMPLSSLLLLLDDSPLTEPWWLMLDPLLELELDLLADKGVTHPWIGLTTSVALRLERDILTVHPTGLARSKRRDLDPIALALPIIS